MLPTLNTTGAALREFGEIKYWLADLQASWIPTHLVVGPWRPPHQPPGGMTLSLQRAHEGGADQT